MIERVLLPVDFSPRDAAAAHYVNQLYRKMKFETVLLHVVPPPDYEAAVLEAGGPVLTELMETRRRIGAKKLEGTCLGELAGQPVQRVLLEGFPSEQIVEYAAKHKVDWIVLPTHGYGPFRRFLLGSVTSRILHEAKCPVFTGAHMEEPKLEEIHFDRIAAAVDLGEDSPRVIALARSLADRMGAKLIAMHAMAGLSGHAGVSFESGNAMHFEAAVKERLAELTQGIGEVETVFDMGDPGKTVAELAKRTKTDLVVIGRSTASGFAAVRTHSLAIIRESGVPVLSV